jgi:hypothetical protein
MPWDVQQFIAPLRARLGWAILLTTVQAAQDHGQISVRTILQPEVVDDHSATNPLNAQKDDSSTQSP